MVSAYIHTTAIKIYTAIAEAGDRGLDAEQLVATSGYARNTIAIYGRWLEDDGAIEIQEINSDAPNRPLKNLYFAIRPPRPRLNDSEKLAKAQAKLKQIAETLDPYRYRGTGSWDARYKGEIEMAIDQAIGIARTQLK